MAAAAKRSTKPPATTAVARIVDANADGIVTKSEVTSARDAVREAFGPKKHHDNQKDDAACPAPTLDGK